MVPSRSQSVRDRVDAVQYPGEAAIGVFDVVADVVGEQQVRAFDAEKSARDLHAVAWSVARSRSWRGASELH